jgi:hypothetical protein
VTNNLASAFTLTFRASNGVWKRVDASGDLSNAFPGADTQVVFFDGANNPVGNAGFTFNKTTLSGSVIGNLSVTNEPYDAALWNGNATVPTKDSVRDKLESIIAGGSDNWLPSGASNSVLSGNAGIGTLPGNVRLNIGANSLGTSPIDGIFLTNSAAAANNVQQYSPSIYWSGNGWGTTASSNQPVSFRQYARPVQGGTPTVDMVWDASVNGAAFFSEMSLNSSLLTVFGGVTCGGTVTSTAGSLLAASAQAVGFSSRSRLFSSADGALEANNSPSNARSTIQFNIPQLTKTTNYQALALDSGLFFNNVGASAARTNWLPAGVAGMHFSFYVDAAQIVSIKPFTNATDVIRWGSILGTTNDDIWSSQVGSRVHLNCVKSGLWVVDRHEGEWTLAAPRKGNSVLVGGTVTVANTTVTANTIVLITRKTAGGTLGAGGFNYTTTAGTGFTINSEDLTGVLSTLDTSTVSWFLTEVPN